MLLLLIAAATSPLAARQLLLLSCLQSCSFAMNLRRDDAEAHGESVVHDMIRARHAYARSCRGTRQQAMQIKRCDEKVR